MTKWVRTVEVIEADNARYRAEFVERLCPKCKVVSRFHPTWGKCVSCSADDLYPARRVGARYE